MTIEKKQNIAIVIALVFHFFGAIGIIYSDFKDWFINATSLNLLLMFGLILFTHQPNNNNTKNKFLQLDKSFLSFIFISFLIGFFSEIIGVNTNLLFGYYFYGNVLGFKIYQVPILIGIQWFVTIYCCGVVISYLNEYTLKVLYHNNNSKQITNKFLPLFFIIDAALLTTLFDYIIEPVAQHLGYWQWQNQEIPIYNYTCWFVISCLIFVFFSKLKFHKFNKFAVHLLIIEAIFFLSIRLHLK